MLRLTHPPLNLRQQLLALPDPGGLLTRLSLYPLAYVARLALLLAWAGSVALSVGTPVADLAGQTLLQATIYTRALRPVWLAMAATLVVWPFAAPMWWRFVGRERHPGDRTHLWAYALLALLIATGPIALSG